MHSIDRSRQSIGFFPGNANSLDRRRAASCRIDFNQRGRHADIAGGDLEMGGVERQRRFQHAIDAAAQNAIVRAGHADVALKRGAAGQDTFVGGGDVGMRAQHGASTAVEIAAHQLHVAGRFGVKIDEDHLDLGWQCRQHAVGRGPRTIDRPHENASQQADDRHGHAVRRWHDCHVVPGAVAGKLAGLTMFSFALQDASDLAAAIDVVAQRDAIDAGGDQLVIVRRRDARAAGGVLAIGHDQVEPARLDRARRSRGATT